MRETRLLRGPGVDRGMTRSRKGRYVRPLCASCSPLAGNVGPVSSQNETALNADLARVVQAVTDELGPESEWPTPVQLKSLAQCVMNAVYSTGNSSEGVIRVLDRYRRRREDAGHKPVLDGPVELLAEMRACGGPEGFADALGNHWRAWQSKTAPYKTEVMYGAAQILATAGIRNPRELEVAMKDATTHAALKREWLGLPGQRSGLTWRFFLMNAGMPGIKADRMITRWTSRALGRQMTPQEAERILTDAAERLGVGTRRLDHALWERERRRR